MSRIYDSWEKLVEAVLRRENDRRIALFQSFSSSSSADVSSPFSFDSAAIDDSSSSLDDFNLRFTFNPFAGDAHLPAGIDQQINQAGPSNRNAAFQPFNEMISVSRISGQRDNPTYLSSQNTLFFRNVMAIEYEEIMKATKTFHPSFWLGGGGFGPVCKGWLHEHNLTAVKPGYGIAVAIKKRNDHAMQGHKEWVDEINYLSHLRHPNLIKMIGYSFDTDNRIVVYEFMPNGSLDNHLFKGGDHCLPWATRIKVAMGAARALTFLHGLEIPVIHRSFRSSDILLDGGYNTKLSDFGLAKDGPTGDETHVSTRVMGAYGYAAPEYMATGHLTTRCDVYGFGVVLLELISGLRVIDRNRPATERNLMEWGKPYLKDKKRVSRIVDKRLKGKYPPNEVYKVAEIVFQCSSLDPRLRPKMSEVVAAFEQL